jgi:hypothetical protein
MKVVLLFFLSLLVSSSLAEVKLLRRQRKRKAVAIEKENASWEVLLGDERVHDERSLLNGKKRYFDDKELFGGILNDLQMSIEITNPPTIAPTATDAPTVAPTVAPTTDAPSPTPTAVGSPTPSPFRTCQELPTAESVLDILETVSDTQQLLDTSTPQGFAYEWLLTDGAILDPCAASEHLLQRYGLAVLFNSTEGDEWDNSMGWLVEPDECTWFGVVCNQEGFLTELLLGT